MLYENKSKITLLKLVQQRHFLLKRLYQAVKGRVYMCVRGIDFPSSTIFEENWIMEMFRTVWNFLFFNLSFCLYRTCE